MFTSDSPAVPRQISGSLKDGSDGRMVSRMIKAIYWSFPALTAMSLNYIHIFIFEQAFNVERLLFIAIIIKNKYVE
jgi:hypothetical protein